MLMLLFFLLVKEAKNEFVPATFGIRNFEYCEDYGEYQVRIWNLTLRTSQITLRRMTHPLIQIHKKHKGV